MKDTELEATVRRNNQLRETAINMKAVSKKRRKGNAYRLKASKRKV